MVLEFGVANPEFPKVLCMSPSDSDQDMQRVLEFWVIYPTCPKDPKSTLHCRTCVSVSETSLAIGQIRFGTLGALKGSIMVTYSNKSLTSDKAVCLGFSV